MNIHKIYRGQKITVTEYIDGSTTIRELNTRSISTSLFYIFVIVTSLLWIIGVN